MEFSSGVYIFHKGIISQVLCGYEVQMNMSVFVFEWKSTFNEPTHEYLFSISQQSYVYKRCRDS